MVDRNIKNLSTKHQQLVRLLVGGNSQSEISRLLNIHKSTVSRLVRDPKVLQEVKRLQELADMNATACVPGIPEKIREGAHQGADVLMMILADERIDPEMLRLKANVALEFLSRAGFAPLKQIQVHQSSFSAHITPEDLEEIRRRARIAAEECGF